MGYTWPLPAGIPVSQPFGTNPGGVNPVGGHTGTDFAAPLDTPVRAPGTGTILHADWITGTYDQNPWWLTPMGGITVVLDCGEVAFVFAHLNSTAMNVGDRVAQGDIVGYTGSTGTASTGPHLHFEALPDGWNTGNGTYGRVDPARYCGAYWAQVQAASVTQTLRPDQRITAAQVNVRDRPTTSASVVSSFAGDTILDFKGFVHGESVNGNDVWFVGAYSGNFIWSGGFKNTGTAGLPDLTPPPKAPTPAPAAPAVRVDQRITGPSGVNLREAPDKNAAVVKTFDPDLVLDFKGYVRATDPYGDGNNIWFVGAYSNTYAWSGAFTNKATTGLTDLTSTAPAPSAPVVKPYDFELDITEVVREDGVVIKVEKFPAHIGNLQLGAGNPTPDHSVIHQFGTLGKDTFESTGTQFAKEGTFVSAYHSASGRRIRQHVALKDRAYHAGPTGNNWYGTETDPAQDPETILTARALLLAVDKKLGRKPAPIRHRDVPGCSTACGAVIDLAKYDVPFQPAPAPAPDPTPAPTAPTAGLDEASVLKRFFDWLVQLFLNRQK
ncbi:peptidoglycan DD-metalloendopeptidase family protein [Sinomonas soli]